MDEQNFLWEHFKLHADQRMKAFNFFVILSIFANGGAFTAIEKQLTPSFIVILGVFIVSLSCIFWIVDSRSHALINLTMPGLIEFEREFKKGCKPFTEDPNKRSRFFRYTYAFRALFVLQIFIGLYVTLYAIGEVC